MFIPEAIAATTKKTVGRVRKRSFRRHPMMRERGARSSRMRRVSVVLTRKTAGKKYHLPVL